MEQIQYINGELYVLFNTLVELGIPADSIRKGVQRGQLQWQAIEAPMDRRVRLLKYAVLPERVKRLVIDRFGCPIRFAKFSMIASVLQPLPFNIEEQIRKFKPNGSSQLSYEEQQRYRVAAQFIEALINLENRDLAPMGFSQKADLWTTAYAYIKAKKIVLPASRRLKAKIRAYKKEGALALIPTKRYGNQNSKKIGRVQEALLVELMADSRKFSAAEVHRQFQAISKSEGWGLESLSYQTVYNHIRRLKGRWEKERHGDKWYMLNREMVINQRKASRPNIEWQIDGTPAALWYFNENSKNLEKIYTVSVMDSHSEAIIGYAFGKTETTQLVAEALRMAIQVQGAIPLQLKSDKGSAMTSGETQNLLKNLGIEFIPSATGRARAKSIENAQRWWMQLDSVYYHNRSGMNLTTKTQDSRINPEALRKKLGDFPRSEAEVILQLAESIHLYNNRVRAKDGKSPSHRQQAEEQPRPFAPERLVEAFGMFRKKGKKLRKYRFTEEGLKMQIAGDIFKYLPDTEVAAFLNKHANITEFYVKYDPTDVEQIALYTLPLTAAEEREEELRFHSYAVLKQLAPQVQAEASKEELATLARYRKVQKEQHQLLQRQKEERAELLANLSLLQGGIDLKTVRKDEYNNAKLELERYQLLGLGRTVLAEEVRKTQAKESQKEEKRLTSINIYKDRYKD